jgi:ParB family transcriptional regulator, chromosome partitioning protein
MVNKTNKKKMSDENFNIQYSPSNIFGKEGKLFNIPLSMIIEDKNQPRKHFDKEGIEELAKSIKEQGLINPITVRPINNKYKIIAGERRFLASRKAGLTDIPSIVRDVEEIDVRVLSLIENLQREDLSDVDKGEAVKELKEKYNLTWEDISIRLGVSKGRVMQIISLLKLPTEIQEDIRSKKLSSRKGLEIKKIKDKKIAKEVHKKVIDEKLSLKDTAELVDYARKNNGDIGRFERFRISKNKFENKVNKESLNDDIYKNLNKAKSSLNELTNINFSNIESNNKINILKFLFDINTKLTDIKNMSK